VRSFLLAAGLGSRLLPLTLSTPKCLATVRGRPLLSYWLDALLPKFSDKVLVNTHHLAQSVEEFVRASRWRDQVELVHEEHLLGTGGTLKANAGFAGEGPVFVAHADNFSVFDVHAFRRAHLFRPPGVAITMMTFDSDSPSSCGIVETDRDGIVWRFHEKVVNPPGNRANGAVYIFEPEVFEFISGVKVGFFELSRDVIPNYLGRIQIYHNSLCHIDIGTPQSLQRANSEGLF
jgi:mannose-1-phosphate guanylyltransferase